MIYFSMSENEALQTNEKETFTAIQQLQEYEKEGYVFHGSPDSNITELDPRPAADVDETNVFNNDTAVFATPSPAAGVIFACMSRDNVPEEIRRGTWSVGSEDGNKIVARIPKKWQKHLVNNSGYVYVLDGTNFSNKGDIEGWQVKSKKSVEPETSVEVSFSDFEKSGGTIIWKEEVLENEVKKREGKVVEERLENGSAFEYVVL